MKTAAKTKQKIEFGDFQTPPELAAQICELLDKSNFQPRSIIEPTCGTGNLLAAAVDKFRRQIQFLGFDISPDYVGAARARFENNPNVSIFQADFFATDWQEVLAKMSAPVLILGNPPWVTNSGLSQINGANAPAKTNFQNFNGLDALTGKSNFDVSEWILIRLFSALKNRRVRLAMLCKTAVARKVLTYAWKNEIGLSNAQIRQIDAARYFGAAVDACLLICDFSETAEKNCDVFDNLAQSQPSRRIGIRDNQLVASLENYEKQRDLNGGNRDKWRSGIKHDCAKVMELTKDGDKFRNGFGELVELESDFVYPLLKSSDLSNDRAPRKFVIVTQKTVGEDTAKIAEIAPQTWNYLLSHAALLDKRASSIYRNRPRFAVFGVGCYSFANWKVAVSGMYKKLCFRVVGDRENKPVLLDDTCYFLPCESAAEAARTAELLNSEIAREFFESFIFWDAKRPITAEILQKLNIIKLKKLSAK